MSVVLSEHLPLLATAPDGIQKLRGLILELAVRGKLVPQDPNDEPASELFKRVDEEKARLTAHATREKNKILPPVGEDDQPFNIPRNWQWVRLGSTVEVLDSLRKPVTKDARQPGPYPYYGASGIVDYVSDYLFDEDLVLVGEDGAKWSVGDRTAFSINGKTWVNNHAHVLRPDRTLLNDGYLVYALVARDLQPFITGTTVPKLNQAKLVSIEVPLPPLAEQHRIVAKVDELMSLCDRLEVEQADAEAVHTKLVDTLLGTLTQSTDAADLAANWQRLAEHFDTLFTTEPSLDALKQTILQLAVMGKLVSQDPNDEPASELLKQIAQERARLEVEGKIKKSKPLPPVVEDDQFFVTPDGWSWCRLQNAFDVRDGTHDSPKFLPKGVPFLTSKNIYGGKLDLSDLKFISELDHIEFSKRSKVDRDDILFAMIGSIGNPVIVDTDLEFSFKNMALFKYFSKSLSSPRYLQIFLSVVAADMKAKAAGGVQSFVALGTIRSQPMALPPLAEQHRIVAKVDELMAFCDCLKADLAESRRCQERLASTLIESALKAA